MSRPFLRQIITQCAGTQDIIKKLASCDPCERKSGLKTVAFLLLLSIHAFRNDCVIKYFHFFLNQTICCWYAIEPYQLDASFEHTKHIFKLINKKILTIFKA